MSKNQCAACGQWAGKRHKCPAAMAGGAIGATSDTAVIAGARAGARSARRGAPSRAEVASRVSTASAWTEPPKDLGPDDPKWGSSGTDRDMMSRWGATDEQARTREAAYLSECESKGYKPGRLVGTVKVPGRMFPSGKQVAITSTEPGGPNYNGAPGVAVVEVVSRGERFRARVPAELVVLDEGSEGRSLSRADAVGAQPNWRGEYFGTGN